MFAIRKIILVLIVVFYSQLLFAENTFAHLKAVKTFQKGSLYHLGKLDVLRLQGTYQEMGKQYGALIKPKLQAFYQQMMDDLKKQHHVSNETLKQTADKLFANYPRRFQEIFLGMAETSGLTLEQHKMLNAFEYYMFNPKLVLAPQAAQCSAIAAWDRYTQGGDLIFGRNYDFILDVNDYKKYLSVVAFNPISGEVPTATITFLGTLNTTTNMNSRGLFIELNSGEPSSDGKVYNDRITTPIMLFSMLLDSTNLKQLDAEFNTIRSNAAFIVTAADSKKAYTYEWPTNGIKRREGSNDGLLVTTNNFVEPSWNLPKLSDEVSTFKRRENLLQLADQQRGVIDVNIMKKMLELPLANGGATSYDAEKNHLYTTFQVIAIPKSLTIWLRAPEYQDWVEIRLKDLFVKQ